MAENKVTNDGIMVSNICKSFQDQTVLDGVNFVVPRGGRAVLVGSSGAGKSTILRIIAGLILPDDGQVYLGGELVSTNKWGMEPRQRQMGFVFQSPTLWPHMTVMENTLFGLSQLAKEEALEHAAALLAKARISHIAGKYPDQISGGEAKRAALVRSIAPCPRYLLVDEPLSNLDDETKTRLLEFTLAMVEEYGMTLVYVTHDTNEGKRVGGKIVHI